MDEVRVGSKEIRYSLADGAVRIQPLGGAVIRIERSRDDGSFCDEPTFTVVKRPTPLDARPLVSASVNGGAGSVDEFVSSLVFHKEGNTLWSANADVGLATCPPQPDSLPQPGEERDAWVLHDHPRVIPPAWGSLPPDDRNDPTSGWQVEESAFDIYLFVYERDLGKLWEEFLSITGPIPVPPLWTFGLWTSRYFPYSHETALDVIEKYRELDIPLDVFVVDTDWRVGASRGYDVNVELFPDMAAFLGECRKRGVRTVFNDHPEPKGMEPLAPGLFEYRRDSLTRILDMGLTAWWFDRNWGDIIPGPAPGLETAVWGQKLYRDIVKNHRPDERPVILSMTANHPASHRYPIWWTGDNFSDWDALAESVRDTLSDGMQLRPYTAPDVGGHVGFPSPEQYIRWIQWATVCPTFRLHCGPRNRYRYPWRFGRSALEVTREYVKLRYRLLPYLYSLAHAARFSGRPLLSGVDPADRDAPSWARDAEFLLGDSLLFSPITMPMVREPAERTPYRFDPPLQRRVWIDRQLDEQSYSTRKRPDVEPRELGYDHEIRINSFNGSEKSVAWGRRYLVVWDGTFVAHRPGWYRFRVIGNGRKELCLDDAEHPQIRTNFDGGTNEAVLELTEGEHPISISFLHQGGGLPVIEVAVSVVEEPVLQSEVATERPAVKSPVWLPKGTWRDLYTGTVHHGRSVVSRVFGIEELPAFVRCGSIVPLAPVVSHTTTAFWTNLSLEVFPHVADGDMATTVYFDDGRSEAYQSGEVATVTAAMERDGSHITIDIGDLVAPSNTPAQSDVDLSVRIHLLPGENLERATINGHDSTPLACTPTEPRLPPLPVSDEQMVFDNAETVAFNGLRPGSRIVLTL